MKLMLIAIVGGATMMTATAALAHHSFAMFDRDKEVTLVGTIKEFQWTNPHSWIQITVPGANGSQEWAIEGGSPNSLSRHGWARTSLKPGDRVTLKIHPLKDGKSGGSFMSATMSGGTVLTNGGAE